MEEIETFDLVATKNGDLIDPNTKKIEQTENELDSVKKDLLDLLDISREAVDNLAGLSRVSQNPIYYDVLAKLIVSSAKAGKEANEVLKTKLDLYHNLKKEQLLANDPDSDKAITTNNNLIVTSNQLLDMLAKSKD